MSPWKITSCPWRAWTWIRDGEWPTGGDGLVTGGRPRYEIYRTADGRYFADPPRNFRGDEGRMLLAFALPERRIQVNVAALNPLLGAFDCMLA